MGTLEGLSLHLHEGLFGGATSTSTRGYSEGLLRGATSTSMRGYFEGQASESLSHSACPVTRPQPFRSISTCSTQE